MATMTEARPIMAEAKGQKTTPVRLSDEAIKWARIASGYTGESMAEYVSRIAAERGKEDAERLHAEATGATTIGEKPARPKRKESQ
jgi:hypothetical protein